MDVLNKDIETCNKLGGKYTDWCKSKAIEKWVRNLEIIRDYIYPWNNQAWDYQQFVKNKYDPEKLGLNRGDDMTTLLKNVDILLKQMDSLLVEPNPDASSRAGVTDQPPASLPPFITQLKKSLTMFQQFPDRFKNEIEALDKAIDLMIKNTGTMTAREYGASIVQEANNQRPPYDDAFFNRNLTGENSSSYFIQVGFCDTKLADEQKCESKKYKWTGDRCYKPRYIYINNKPGLNVGKVKNLRGLIPSMVNSALQLNPDSFMGLINGYNVPGVEIQPCNEDYTNFLPELHSCKRLSNDSGNIIVNNIGGDNREYTNYYYMAFYVVITLVAIIFLLRIV